MGSASPEAPGWNCDVLVLAMVGIRHGRLVDGSAIPSERALANDLLGLPCTASGSLLHDRLKLQTSTEGDDESSMIRWRVRYMPNGQ